MAHLLDPKTITNYRDYLSALTELEALMLCDPDTPAGQRFNELVELIDDYELSLEPTVIRPAMAA